MPTPEENMFAEAVTATKNGERARARDLLTRLLKTETHNPQYWIWMSAVVDSAKERTLCLKEALRIDSQNTVARRGLVIQGALPPDEALVLPAAYQKREWMSKAGFNDAAAGQQGKPISRPRIAMIAAAGLLLVGLVAFAISGIQRQRGTPRYMPIINYPTDTPSARAEATQPSVAQEKSGAGTLVPLSALLKATYTPTPLYVNTPHSVSEAFRIGQRAYQRGEFQAAIRYFEQSADLEPDAADIIFYLAEAHRQLEDYSQALVLYNQALEKSPNFAPAYLGRARVQLAQNPERFDAVLKDLQLAIQKDPLYAEALITLAEVQVHNADPAGALESLDRVEKLLPGSAMVSLYRAEAYLAGKQTAKAVESARRANQLDVTLLLPYRIIGEALFQQGDTKAAYESLKTYLQYAPADASAWTWFAQAQVSSGDRSGALKSLDKSLALEKDQLNALLLRGQLLLDAGRADAALDDFQAVSRLDKESYLAGLGWGKALMALNYPGDAYDRFERSRALAQTEKQKAELLFWRAQSLDALKEYAAARRDYQSLLDLPAGVAESVWLSTARTRVAALTTPTATPRVKTATPTPTPTSTRQPTQTKVPTQTRQPTATRSP